MFVEDKGNVWRNLESFRDVKLIHEICVGNST